MTEQLDPPVRTSVLDNPVWWSATGAHAAVAITSGGAAIYPPEVGLFAGMTGGNAWADLAGLLAPDRPALLVGATGIPADWLVHRAVEGVQLAATVSMGEPDEEAVRLGPADVPEMLDLVRRTEPGPFLPRTIELGHYLGIRRGGALVAMAGERMRPAGWTEISAVCTDPAYRGQGLATRLIRAVAVGIDARGDMAFLHTGADNTGAIRVYEKLGFAYRRPIAFQLVRPPRS
ncbi:MAG TPA: GNAT family N-acetyltransferase [Pseudonocardiaceae bacterium]|jgi:ribosomal protein S18 acetylase RimI-like enzyme|nr:GNAT family N-acetyltransferase [Pseudonocardiaceae bacterium]